MPGMWRATAPAPPSLGKFIKNSPVFDNAVTQGNIELQHVAIRPKAAIAQKVARVVDRKKIFADG